MYKFSSQIVVFETSRIISEGLQSILYQSEIDCRVYYVETLDHLKVTLESRPINMLITSCMMIMNREKEIKKIRRSYPLLNIVGIDTGFLQKHSIQLFDSTFTLYDSSEQIIHSISKLVEKNQCLSSKKTEEDNLTDREIEVLTRLVNGQSNKEIADFLNISIHTVISHRKNITFKTGIRSQSGLTIYAISKKIIEIDDYLPENLT
ncbi:MAG: LuxR C-terminal-related transcriptional regulator [Dysgonamonadaceae bacterium]